MSRVSDESEDDGIPGDVRAFIAEHIGSAELSRELYIAEESASRRLADFHRHGLLERESARPLIYRYSPHDSRASQVIDSLAAIYQERRVRVINLIFSQPVDHVRSFANAFKFRKKND